MTIRALAISRDPEVSTTLRELLTESGRIDLAWEIAVPFAEISRREIAKIEELDPALIFLDFQEDPATGVRLANFLSQGNPQRRFIGIGPSLDSPLLIKAMRAGLSEYLTLPLDREELESAISRAERRLSATSEEAVTRTPGELFAVFSPKGGAGSTTVATNLAIHLHRLSGKKTLLIDLDPELGEIAVLLGMQPRFTFVDMLRNFHRMDTELLASYIEKHASGVHLLSAPFQPERQESVTGEGIRKILPFLQQHYDYVVVDAPKSFSPATLATFERADQIYLVINVDLPSLRNVKRCQPLLDRIVGAVEDRVRLVVNRYQASDTISLDEVERTLGLPVYATLANDYESVIASINAGQPVIDSERSPFAADLRALGARITGSAVRHNGRRIRLPGWITKFGRNSATTGK